MALTGFLGFGRDESLLGKTLDRFGEMIEACHWMYQSGISYLWEASDGDGQKEAIYARDIEVNKAVREIRKMIVEHLAITGRDGNYCLVLMSVVKDVERVGDYCKNVIEVRRFHHPKGDDNVLVAEYKDIQAQIDQMFVKIRKTFRDSDEATAQELIDAETTTTKRCDALIEQVLALEGLNNHQAVGYALLARYLKRIAAHLGNVATSVVMPVHKLDFYDEKYMPEK